MDLSLDTSDKKYKDLAKDKFLESAKLFPENVDADYLVMTYLIILKIKNTNKLCW